VQQVNKTVTEMDKVVQQNAAAVQQSASAAEAMRRQAEALVKAVSAFRIGGDRAQLTKPRPSNTLASSRPAVESRTGPALAAKEEWEEF